MIDLFLFATWKNNNYNTIVVILDHLTKIVYYKSVKVSINAPRLTKVIIDIVL